MKNMMNDMNNSPLNEKFLDDAATEVIGAHRPEESDAFVVALGQADDAHQQATRDLRDTIARMAGSAPYMEPPTRLRGTILQATAPKSFKIEDYRRDSDVSPKWLRRALVASIGFLIFAAWYNATTKTAYDTLVKNYNALTQNVKDAQPKVAELVNQNTQLSHALFNAQVSLAKATFANPYAPKGLVQDETGRQRVLLQDPATAQYMLLVSDRSIPPGQYAILSGLGSDGKPREFRALAIGQPDDGNPSNFNSPMAIKPLNVQWKGMLTNDNKSIIAGMNPFDAQH